MRKVLLTGVVNILLVSIFTWSMGTVIAKESQEVDGNGLSNNSTYISVTISGLEKGDKATLILSPEMDESLDSVIAEKVVLGEDTTIIVDLYVDLKDGNYQLVIDTSDKYFRTPKGYLFKVHDAVVINPRSRSMLFELIPPSDRQYKPYRGPVKVEGASEMTKPKPPITGEGLFMMEYFLSLSILTKQSTPELLERESRSAGYHYMGYQNSYENEGIWGSMDVVNTGVRHDIEPNTEFTCDRVYLGRNIGDDDHWMEIGWVEHSEQLDYRYLYEYDTTYGEWRIYFQVSSSIDVAVKHSSGNYWRAWYWNGSDWVSMAYENLGFSSAGYVINGGEVYTYDGTHPSFPSAYTSTSKIYVSNSWDTWDNYYDAYTLGINYPPYYKHVITDYYYFYIYKD